MLQVNNQLLSITDLHASLPAARLRYFMRASGFDPVRAQKLHDWNEEIGAALFGPLQRIELALRTRTNRAFTAAYGAEWYNATKFRQAAHHADRVSIAEARNRVVAAASDISAEAIMSKATFGLCVGLLRPTYNPDVWSKHLRSAFPLLPPTEGREDLAKRASQAASLRNQIDHHEPLIGRDLSRDHSRLLELLDRIDIALATRARADQRVQQLLRSKPTP